MGVSKRIPLVRFAHVQELAQPQPQPPPRTHVNTNAHCSRASDIVCLIMGRKIGVELKFEMCTLCILHENLILAHIQNTPQPCHQSMKLNNMTINIETKLVFKFEVSQMCAESSRAKKL